jgi:SPP1 family predicted phage head-tail adaptor
VPSIGTMRERVLIQKKITSSDGQGGKTVRWQDFEESFCSIVTLSLAARSRYQQYQIDVTHSISLRNIEGLDENMRMLLITDSASSPKWFDIVSVEDDKQRKRFSTVMVRESKVKQVRRRNR